MRGGERIRGAYAWRKLLRSGAVIACGSDFPVESVNPLWGIYAAVTRQDHSEWPEGGWYADERMTVAEANPPIASGTDDDVLRLYDRAATRYDLINDLVSFGTSNWYRRRTILSLELPPDATLVDVGSGTGSLALAAQRFLRDSPAIVAVDPSTEMRRLAVKAGVRDVRPGSLDSIPVPDRSMDAVVSGYAIRYAEDRVPA